MRISFFSTVPYYPLNAAFYSFHGILPFLNQKHQVQILFREGETPDISNISNGLTNTILSVVRFYPPATRFSLVNKISYQWYKKFHDPFQNLKTFAPDLFIINEGAAYHWLGLTRFIHPHSIGSRYCVMIHQQGDLNYLEPNMRDRAREFYLRAEKIFFYSHRNLQVTERQLAIKLPNVEYISYPQRASGATIPWPPGKCFKFAIVARLCSKEKCHDLLLEAFSSHQWKQRDWKLNIYGSDNVQNNGVPLEKTYLQDLVVHYGLQNRVFFHGIEVDLQKIWSENHMLVLPSNIEGDSLALTEALSFARPVLATCVGGAEHWIQDNETGILALGPSVPAIQSALERAWLKRDSWEKMGIAARNRYLSLRDPDPIGSFWSKIAPVLQC